MTNACFGNRPRSAAFDGCDEKGLYMGGRDDISIHARAPHQLARLLEELLSTKGRTFMVAMAGPRGDEDHHQATTDFDHACRLIKHHPNVGMLPKVKTLVGRNLEIAEMKDSNDGQLLAEKAALNNAPLPVIEYLVKLCS